MGHYKAIHLDESDKQNGITPTVRYLIPFFHRNRYIGSNTADVPHLVDDKKPSVPPS